MTSVVAHSPGRALSRFATALLLSLALLASVTAPAGAAASKRCPQGATSCSSSAAAKGGIKPVAGKPSATPTPVPRTVVTKPAGPSLWDRITGFMLTWLPLIFMGAITLLIGLSLRYLPRTKPQEIQPDTGDSVHWGDVAGADEAKEELREVVEFLRDPKRFKKLGAKVPKGILLHGPPGTGKTLLAKAVANEAKASFFAQSASSFVEMFAGLGAARIRRLFREARKRAPAIIFIDELDAFGATRGKDISGEKDQTLNQLLVEMDGFKGTEDLVVIAASNLLEKLDPALLRPGRFDRQVFVSPPDLRGRESILKVHSADKPLHEVDLELVARQTSGLTGADLANICNEAAIFAGRHHRDVVLMQDFEAALERIVAGMESRRVMNGHEKKVVAWHEAGHALCSELLPSIEKVHKISIVPRGRALGYTLNLPEEDRYLKTKEELIDYMVVLLAGRVAEHVVFGAITTGASDDLKKVYEISRQMVAEYGMGTGLASRRLPVEDYSVSENTRRLVDEEQQELTDLAHRSAMNLIVENRELLDEFAQTLLSNEVLARAAIDRIRAGYEIEEGAYEPGHGATEVYSEREREPGPAQVAAAERLDPPTG